MSEQEKSQPKGPWVRHLLLWTAFVAWVVVGVWTVMIPALEDAPDESSSPEESAEEEGVDSDTSD